MKPNDDIKQRLARRLRARGAANIPLLVTAALAMSPAANPHVTRFRDLEGHEVTIRSPVTRVVTLPIPSASTFIAIDGSPRRLVGIHPQAQSAIDEGILGRIFPEARRIDSGITAQGGDGFMPNVETIAGLNPDIVVQWGGRGDDIVAPLRNAGLNTALLLYGTETYARGNLTMMGAIAGKPDKAQALIAWRDVTIDDIQRKLAGAPHERPPKVLYLQRALGGFVAAGANTYNDYYIRLTGGVNAAGGLDGALAVDVEQIAAWNPDVILLDGFEAALRPERIYDDAILGGVAAAQNRRVYKIPMGGYRWDPPSQENPLTFMWLADLLHPTVFAYDLRDEITQHYRTMYHAQVSPSDLDDVLRVSMNGHSRDYARFAAPVKSAQPTPAVQP